MSQPSPSTLLRAPRRQRPPLCCERDSVLRGSCLPWNSGKLEAPIPARANDCMPSRRSRAEPRQFLHIRMSEKRHAVPDPVVSSHVKSCLTGHCPATWSPAMEIVRVLNNNPKVLRRLQQCNCNSTLIAAISKISCQKGEMILRSNELSKHPRGDDGFFPPCCSKSDALSPTCKSPDIQF